MKKTAYYYLSLAAIVAGGLVSCQEEEQGFSKEELKASVYQREFLKTYGTPAENHKWGFDALPFFLPEMRLSSSTTRSLTRTDAIVEFGGPKDDFRKKPGQPYAFINNQNYNVNQCFELPANITPKEHDEVYYWFSHHKVNWENEQPTNCLDSHSRDCDGFAYEYQTPEEIAGGVPLDYGSLSAFAGNASIGTAFEVNWAWIQNVASDSSQDEYRWDRENKQNTQIEGSATGSQMSEMNFQLVDGASYKWWENGQQVDKPCGGQYLHLDSFNGGNGPGYPWSGDRGNDSNALFVLDTNFNDCIYQCCGGNGGSYHNKYYIVYLKGDGYEGYYLGMDYEADGASNTNQSVKANGICNDWIIKLTVPYAIVNTGDPVRIMCEDLGGVYDYDFNDIVIDATPKQHDNSGKHPYLEINLRALGGTLPIYVAYDGIPLWGNTSKGDLHNVLYNKPGVPVNVTNGNVDNSGNNAIIDRTVWSTKIASTAYDNGNNTNWLSGGDFNIISNKKFDYSLIQIYIMPEGEAQWIQLANYLGVVPLKLCVPQDVNWAIECAGMPHTKTLPANSKEDYEKAGRSMGMAYPGFYDWVRDPARKFWSVKGNTQYYFNESQLQ